MSGPRRTRAAAAAVHRAQAQCTAGAVAVLREVLRDEWCEHAVDHGGTSWELRRPQLIVYPVPTEAGLHAAVEVGDPPHEARVTLTGRRDIDARLVRAVLGISAEYEAAAHPDRRMRPTYVKEGDG